MLKRHAIQVLRQAGHTLGELAALVGVSKRSVQLVAAEAEVTHLDAAGERARRRVGRPLQSRRDPRLGFGLAEPDLLGVEIFRRGTLAGYTGSKSASYGLVRTMRPVAVRPSMRFEGLPGEFTQHDFGEVDVRFFDGRTQHVHFFASRLK